MRLISIPTDRKSTLLNSSHLVISYAVFCLKKKPKQTEKSAATERLQMCTTDHLDARQHRRPYEAGTIPANPTGLCGTILLSFFFFKMPGPPRNPPLSPHPPLSV